MCLPVAVCIRDELAIDGLVRAVLDFVANRGFNGTNVFGFDFGFGIMKHGVGVAFGLGCINRVC